MIATIGLEMEDKNDTYKIFNITLKDAYTSLLPGCSVPRDADQLEEDIFELLPVRCRIKLTSTNIISFLKCDSLL